MPTEYDGSLSVALLSDKRLARRESNERHESRSSISDEQHHAGSHSLCIVGGGYQDIFYGCDAGSKTITVWVKPPVVGKSALKVYDNADVVGIDLNTGTGAWEQLSVSFTAEKKVYTVRLANYAIPDGDSRAYFDDLL